MSSSHVVSLFSQLGEAFGLPLAPDEGGFCALQIDEKYLINFMVSDDQENLTIFCQVGLVDAESQPELVVEILSANLFWRDTGGNTLGLEAESGAVVLMKQLSLTSLTYPALETVLQDFISASEKWFARISESEPEETETAEESLEHSLLPGIRA